MNKEIDIAEIIPFMSKGWVAMDEDGNWSFFTTKPIIDKEYGIWRLDLDYITVDTEVEVLSTIFNIKPAEDWTKSLIRIKGE